MYDIRLLYRSVTSSFEFDPVDMEILKSSLVNNSRDGITGFLARAGEQFFQVLEGPGNKIYDLMERLRLDPRHSDVEILLQERAGSERLFEDWSMGYDYLIYDQFDLSIAADGTRPVVFEAVAHEIIRSLSKQASEVLLYGSIFPFSRRSDESERDFMSRICAA